MQAPREVVAPLSLSGTSLRDSGEGDSSRGQDFRQCTWMRSWLGRRIGQMCSYILIHGLWPMVWTGRDMMKKIDNKDVWGRGMWIDLSGPKKVKIFVSHVKLSKG